MSSDKKQQLYFTFNFSILLKFKIKRHAMINVVFIVLYCSLQRDLKIIFYNKMRIILVRGLNYYIGGLIFKQGQIYFIGGLVVFKDWSFFLKIKTKFCLFSLKFVFFYNNLKKHTHEKTCNLSLHCLTDI